MAGRCVCRLRTLTLTLTPTLTPTPTLALTLTLTLTLTLALTVALILTKVLEAGGPTQRSLGGASSGAGRWTVFDVPLGWLQVLSDP